MDSLRQRDRRRHAVERLVAVERKHRLQANSDRALRQLRRARRECDDRPVLARAKPVHEAGELAQPNITPADLGRLQPPPPQRERPRVRLHRVRRTRDPQVLEVLLGRVDRKAVATNDRPGRRAARQPHSLNPSPSHPRREMLGRDQDDSGDGCACGRGGPQTRRARARIAATARPYGLASATTARVCPTRYGLGAILP